MAGETMSRSLSGDMGVHRRSVVGGRVVTTVLSELLITSSGPPAAWRAGAAHFPPGDRRRLGGVRRR